MAQAAVGKRPIQSVLLVTAPVEVHVTLTITLAVPDDDPEGQVMLTSVRVTDDVADGLGLGLMGLGLEGRD